MLTNYNIYIKDRQYNLWEIFEINKFDKTDLDINPIDLKLFNNDIFTINNSKQIVIVNSSIRDGKIIPGVLILDGNKTYGREKKSTAKNGRLLYKCIPDDICLPSFLVPYEIKNIGFSKVFKNIYVIIIFDNWVNKHPIAKLNSVIGPVDILYNFYEYQLYCKNLNLSIRKFQKDTSKAIENHLNYDIFNLIQIKYPLIEDRTDQIKWNIITIDNFNTIDIDDAFSFIALDNNINLLSIYISNVTILIDILDLWNSFTKRISTIYLPNKKIVMLPTILSEHLCSLQKNVKRVAFVIDIYIENNYIIDIKFNNSFIKVTNNYVYDDNDLLTNTIYKDIFYNVKNLSKNYKYINNITNSHDLVSYLMILMNYQCAKVLITHKTGIFRSTIIKKDNFNKLLSETNLSEDVIKFIKIWNSYSCQYINGSNILDNTRHDILDVDAYIHITSPIRRLVDLLNMIQFQKTLNIINFNENAYKFYNKWIDDLDYINKNMKLIRKIQVDCSLLELFNNNPDILLNEYDGYLFDRINKNDGFYKYNVFLPKLKLYSRISLRDYFDNFQNKKFKLFLFNDEDTFKKKIRLNLL